MAVVSMKQLLEAGVSLISTFLKPTMVEKV